LKITILGSGTSQGVPVIGCQCEVCASLDYRDKRLRSSVFIQTQGKNFVIDTGPDFRQQMLRENIDKLDAVILTHSHKDHIAGLDDVRAFNYLQKADMPIYGSAATLQQVKTEFYYAFEAIKYPGTPQLQVHEINESPFSIEGVKKIPLPVMHMKMPVLGFRIGDFCYITYANHISESTLDKMKNCSVLILNALQRDLHPSHFTFDQAIEMATKINAKQTYFTHISHKLGTHKSVEKELLSSVRLAYDGLTIQL
jgi:phosphoribosyl 1,2-cyclic phosphate phosphodiesterase